MMKKNMVKKVHKLLASIYILAICCIGVTGCRGPQYTEDEAKVIVEKGTALMDKWISKNCPGGKLVEIDHWDQHYGSGPSYLTDFVFGTMNDGNRDRSFSANIVTGFVALEPDDEMMESFNDCCKKIYLESLGLDSDTEIYEDSFHANISYAPLCEGSKDRWAENAFNFWGLQGELVLQNGNVDEYVNNPDRGMTISISGWMRNLSDDFGIERFTYEDILERQDKYNIKYDYLIMENSNESLHVLDDYKYEKWQYEDFDGRTVYSRCVLREAEKDSNGTIISKEYTPSPKDSVKIEKTGDGYKFNIIRSEELYFILYVPEGDELLKHNYIEKATSAGLDDEELTWQETEHGWTLVDKRGNNLKFYTTTELVIND
ncbi:MAG: hypothetical protein J5802_02035 [Butyrivibrio sp.]|nr:hypothetical protein [Butyrivibrio sp.]